MCQGVLCEELPTETWLREVGGIIYDSESLSNLK